MLENPTRHTSCSRCIPPIDFFLELVQPTVYKQIIDNFGTFIGIPESKNIQVIFRLVQLVTGFLKSFIRCFCFLSAFFKNFLCRRLVCINAEVCRKTLGGFVKRQIKKVRGKVDHIPTVPQAKQ